MNVPAQSVAAISGNPHCSFRHRSLPPASAPSATALRAADSAPTRADRRHAVSGSAAASLESPSSRCFAPPRKITYAAAVPVAPHAVPEHSRTHRRDSGTCVAGFAGADLSNRRCRCRYRCTACSRNIRCTKKSVASPARSSCSSPSTATAACSDISVLESTPDHVFDRVAIAALKQWRFGAPSRPGAALHAEFRLCARRACTGDGGLPRGHRFAHLPPRCHRRRCRDRTAALSRVLQGFSSAGIYILPLNESARAP